MSVRRCIAQRKFSPGAAIIPFDTEAEPSPPTTALRFVRLDLTRDIARLTRGAPLKRRISINPQSAARSAVRRRQRSGIGELIGGTDHYSELKCVYSHGIVKRRAWSVKRFVMANRKSWCKHGSK
jgi:hypothetical protein